MTVVGHVGERVGTVEVGIRRILQRTVFAQSHRPVNRLVDNHRGQCVTVDVRIVFQQPGCLDDQFLVFAQRVAVIGGHRCVVYRFDRDIHRGRIAVGLTVVGHVGERVRPVEIGIRRVLQRAVFRQSHGAVQRGVVQRRGQRVPLGIRVIFQNTASLDDQRLVFAHRVAVIGSHRRLVGRFHHDRHRGQTCVGLLPVSQCGHCWHGCAGLAIYCPIRELIRTRETGFRLVRKPSIGLDNQFAMGRRLDQNGGHPITLGVDIICQHAGTQLLVAGHQVRVVHGLGRTVGVDGLGQEAGTGRQQVAPLQSLQAKVTRLAAPLPVAAPASGGTLQGRADTFVSFGGKQL